MDNALKGSTKVFKRRYVTLFVTMLLSAISCLVASFVLSHDAVILAANPSAALSCDVNAIISCGQVALSQQAQIFGFPNAFLGLICEPIVIMIAVSGLAGVKFPRWMMATAQGVYLLGLIFALWLFYQSAFVIGAFCPWCLIITVGTTLTFFTMLRYNIIYENLYFSKKLSYFAKYCAWLRIDTFVAFGIIAIMFFIMVYNYGGALFL